MHIAQTNNKLKIHYLK